jgi:predicted unusual protein kinase regulating ubiquinone biosynthesis (AarF/ABC1/UbiB family)
MADTLRDEDGRLAARAERLGAAGDRLAQTMGELKGAAMKLGQMLSVDNELLPEEMRKTLAVLQRQAPPMAFDQVKGLIEERLGAPLEAHFERLDPEVLGAASLGQVHAGVLCDGTRVAVKVQYPGIAGTIKSDMANLRALLRVTPIPGLKGRVDDYVAELERAFVTEADYVAEASNLNLFNGLLESMPGVVVPRPMEALCRPELLVMEQLDGVRLEDAWATMDQEQRDQTGQRLMDFYAYTFHCHQALHSDPHPGNFLILDDGSLGILDFGCVRHFDASRTDNYLRMLLAMWSDDGEAAVRLYQELGFGHGARVADPDVVAEFNRIAFVPFLHEGLFDCGAWSFGDEMRRFLVRHPEMLRLNPEPHDLMYMRVLSGLRGMLNEGGCRVDIRGAAEKMCALRLP